MTEKLVTFIQNAIPPLRDGTYTLAATQNLPGQNPGTFGATATLVVTGERFTLDPTEIDSVFPPELANGEYAGVLPDVVLTSRTLPWQRTLDTPGSSNRYPEAPWMAVLVCDDAAAPVLQPVVAKDLVPLGTPIYLAGGKTPVATGTLPPNLLSYGAAVLGTLGYGETPDDPTTVIDLPIAMFDQIAPAAVDVGYLAHIREVDTADAPDGGGGDAAAVQRAVVIANRLPPTAGRARAFLVSLEGMADYLPGIDGTQSSAIGPEITAVRLIVYRAWSFTTNDLDETLAQLLSALDTPPRGGMRITTLTLPVTAVPTPAEVAQAMANQAAGTVSAADATVLMQNALLMGYAPLDHHLRHGGNTVSFYRGPLVPYEVPSSGVAYYSGPDAATAYNPQTGLFDVSYGAAWQLGQLLALQSTGMANQLYQWKRQVTRAEAMAVERKLLEQRFGAGFGTAAGALFPSIVGHRAAGTDEPPPLPDEVATWFGNLAQLQGVPFNYLVPDPRMLPPESLRLFHLDANWMDALIDGAFSIGSASLRANGGAGASLEARHAPAIRQLARAHMGRRSANRRAGATAMAAAPSGTITGLLIRSQAVSGWPNLRYVAFSDPGATVEIPPVRIASLASDTTLCLFAGPIAALYIREAPEQLHHGVEGPPGAYHTTLRSVSGGPGNVPPGAQYTSNTVPFKSPCDPSGNQPWTCLSTRSDGRTLLISTAASAIHSRLATDFDQKFPNGFTSAELALELTKGVVEVEFAQ